ncbi:aconitate hydratase A [Desulfomarina profundi]|uniref:Aconitate hydratase n=1 Tax=Desulfomarina profundi TaxID=2772557 RepID=A0A8D5FM61_9BACT|nr:aconitate hydratase AcnA [Desulfomarina profundi]BCL63106.1 aconitate hydratase A [Desulfomarina profundi]
MDNLRYIKKLQVGAETYNYFDLSELSRQGLGSISRLPYSIRILVENLLRKYDGTIVKAEDLQAIVNWEKKYDTPVEIPYHPARVLMQDFTGVPAVVDIAAMRDAVKDQGGDPAKINPVVPVELVADHSVQVDYFGTSNSLTQNVAREYERNGERYKLLKWAQMSFDNFKIVPPNSGICHQVNLEYLGRVIFTRKDKEGILAYPDTVVGLDSHTPMINGIGVMGWGVGGIEAEAVMLGQPYYMPIPEVTGVRLTGKPEKGITATDIVLTLTQLLRQHDVVEKFVEYFGPGMSNLSIPDRATISNMTPEYGATLGFFPIDEKTIDYLKMTGRQKQAALTAAYAHAQSLFYEENDEREYSTVIEFDLSSVEPSLAGPARPQDHIPLSGMQSAFAETTTVRGKQFLITLNGRKTTIQDGSVVIAAITSCTNTSNPYVLLGAGLLAREAVKRGLTIPPHVKTSFAPGSKVVSNYLEAAGLMPYFEALGFHIAAFGCTTCIGNSGPLHPELEELIRKNDLNVAAVLSGNRNFEARIHQRIKSNFLASPLLVMAFALAGRIDIDLTTAPLGTDPNNQPVYLDDLWPDQDETEQFVQQFVTKERFAKEYASIFDGDDFWKKLDSVKSTTYSWDEESTYIKKPPFFDGFTTSPPPPEDLEGARAFLLLGDSVTTDHISPAGAIPEHYPAGQYLLSNNIAVKDFNSYGSRRGNHEVMMRGTFGNIRIKNRMVQPKEGGFTLKYPENKELFNYDAAMQYLLEDIPLIVLAGKEYGTGSSRDWAAKGTMLLGIKTVIAGSYERIHRNNLVGMGVLPLVFKDGEDPQSLGLDGTETYSIHGLSGMGPGEELQVIANKDDGTTIRFQVISRLDTAIDLAYYRHGGILPYVLRQFLS